MPDPIEGPGLCYSQLSSATLRSAQLCCALLRSAALSAVLVVSHLQADVLHRFGGGARQDRAPYALLRWAGLR
jgi:hypothetical protein